MADATDRPTLILYRRPDCHLCDDAEVLLRDEFSQRQRAGLAIPTVERVDISADGELEARYGERIPVFVIGAEEVDLVTTASQVRAFLEAALPAPKPGG